MAGQIAAKAVASTRCLGFFSFWGVLTSCAHNHADTCTSHAQYYVYKINALEFVAALTFLDFR